MTSNEYERLADRSCWLQVRSLDELARATTSWLRREIRYHPAYLGPPADETGHLIESLARINAGGLVTTCSQPGLLLDGHRQRAFVEGFCADSVAMQLDRRLRDSGLVVQMFSPGTGGEGSIAVTTIGDEPCTWLGRHWPRNDVAGWSERADSHAAYLVQTAWAVQIVDPVWGRDEVLWPWVVAALELSPEVERTLRVGERSPSPPRR